MYSLKETQQKLRDSSTEEPRLWNQRLLLIEAALYVAGRPLDLKTLASLAKTRSRNLTKQLALGLKREYDNRETSLEILQLEESRFVMQLKPAYSHRVQRLALRPLLTIGPLKTLSYIAYRQPVSQKQVLNVRGHHVYSHLKQLEELGLISREGKGRTKIIRSTQFFADYFGLSHDLRGMKRQLKKVFGFVQEHEEEKQ
jgi:segregation and condensation protein B